MNRSKTDIDSLKVSLKAGLQTITFNRPEKKNALSREMLLVFPMILEEAAVNEKVNIVVVTGTGDYYTSGNDLTNFTSSVDSNEDGEQDLYLHGRNMLHRFQQSFIDFPKPLIAVVNGPAIGIGVTTLALFDVVFASNMATFVTPFTTLGQTPEATSTYLFPRLMGFGKAANILMFGKKMTAEEAFRVNIVTEVIPKDDFPQLWKRLQEMASLPPKTLMNAKYLMRKNLNEKLSQANTMECDQLINQWHSEEFTDSIMKFFSRKSKL